MLRSLTLIQAFHDPKAANGSPESTIDILKEQDLDTWRSVYTKVMHKLLHAAAGFDQQMILIN